MIKRTYDAQLLSDLVDVNFDPDDWVYDYLNVALIDDKGNIGMFEFELPGVYSGHYFFTSRGKEAKEIALDMLYEAFNHYGMEVIRGLTPLQKLGARWMSRQCGFTSYGVVTTQLGPCEVFVQTKDQFNERNTE